MDTFFQCLLAVLHSHCNKYDDHTQCGNVLQEIVSKDRNVHIVLQDRFPPYRRLWLLVHDKLDTCM